MKKLLFCAAALTLLIGMAACDDSKDKPQPDKELITLSTETLTFQAASGTQTVTVTGEDWATEESEDWIMVEEFDGEFKVTVEANTVDSAREGTITVSNSGDSKTVTVEQAAASPDLNVDIATLPFDGQGATMTVTVTSGIAWNAVATDGSEWITITPDTNGNTFDVTVPAHLEDGQRQGTITVSNGVKETTVEVTQDEIAWYDFVDVRARYDDSNVEDNLGEPWLQFWGSKINTNFQPAEDCWYLSLSTVIYEPDLSGTTIELPEGTYDWKTGGTPPAIVGFDNANNFIVYMKKGVSGETTECGLLEGSSLVVEKNGDEYSLKFLLMLSDGSIFKARYIGRIPMDNPLNTGLSDDVDFGIINDGTGLAGCAVIMVQYGFPAGWLFQLCGPGVTFADKNSAPQGTGYYISMDMNAYGDGYSISEDTYEVKSKNIVSEYGIRSGYMNGAREAGTWFYRLEDGVVVDKAIITSGSVKVVYNTDGTSSFEIDVVEELGKSIKGTFNGKLEWYEIQ